ncbi:MAG: hypothetical protein JOZ39_10320 [Chloroflexi bacterium]|nr:hypothetical protein [Chloroflexota bacterium]
MTATGAGTFGRLTFGLETAAADELVDEAAGELVLAELLELEAAAPEADPEPAAGAEAAALADADADAVLETDGEGLDGAADTDPEVDELVAGAVLPPQPASTMTAPSSTAGIGDWIA